MERTRREAIAEILETRFETNIPQSIADSLDGIENLDTLKVLFKRAIAIGSLEEFEQLLAEETE